MEFLTGVFLFYSFIAMYFSFLFFLIYFKNRKKLFYYPPVTKKYEVSFVVPCYNEEKSIGQTIENIMNIGYSNLKKIIVVDDCSKDSSFKIMKEYEKKYPELVLAVQTPKNTGNAAGAKNYGSKFAKTELICFTDADSFPEKGALDKMVGFFDDKEVGAVTSSVCAYNQNTFLERVQAIEYTLVKFTRKLLEFIDSIYVTPGPLALYRRNYFEEIGKFDESNLTEDIEIAWRFLSKGYKVKMSLPATVYSIVPNNLKTWKNQRLRWNFGGVQTILKYKKKIFNGTMLGNFVVPFFILSWFLGLSGLGFLAYKGIKSLALRYFIIKDTLQAEIALIRLNDFSFVPSIIFFFSIFLIFIGISYSIISISHVPGKGFKKSKIFSFLAYELFYMLASPIILVISVLRLIRGKKKW